ncbi:MAG: universal stress protein [Caldilineaceae bacterium]|nr:universal stress protein [Caldilineaceae bacterium]
MAVNDVVEDGAINILSRPILVPMDGSDVANGILPHVLPIAGKANIPLVLLAAVDPDAIDCPASVMSAATPAGGPMAICRARIEESSRVHAQDTLHRVAAHLKDDGMEAKTTVAIGDPAEEILRVSEEEGCGLIAMSTHGRNPIGRSILGSITDRVIRASNVPVLTVTPERAKKHQEEGAPLTTIVVPLDGSELAQRALPYVGRLARILSMEVLLARVVRTENPTYTETDLGFRVPAFREEVNWEATEYLEQIAQRLRDKGLTVRSQVLTGSAAQALVNLAHETPRNLIAMTTHGRTGLSRWMMGSVASTLVRRSGDPVLVIRPQS